MKILAIIPARGGSKGIPHKNIIDLNGHPLIEYTIKASNRAREKGILERVIVSTDDKEIADISRKCGGEVPFIRPAELAADKSKSIGFVIHALEFFKERNKEFDAVMILQPTSPLRSFEDICEAVEQFEREGEDSLISCTEDNEFNSLGAYFIENGKTLPLDKRHNLGMRRQDYPKLVVRNGAIFLTKVDYLIRTKKIISDNPSIYLMPYERSSNIDTISDFEKCKAILDGEHNEN